MIFLIIRDRFEQTYFTEMILANEDAFYLTFEILGIVV